MSSLLWKSFVHTPTIFDNGDHNLSADSRPLPEMRDGSFLMWAVLAIARLDQLIPSTVDAGLRDSVVESRLRDTINDIGFCFGDEDSHEVWTSRSTLSTDYLMQHLKVLGTITYCETEEQRDTPHEFVYLWSILNSFHQEARTTPRLYDLTPQGMCWKIADVLEQKVGDVVIPVLFRHLDDVKNGMVSEEEFGDASFCFIEWIVGLIEAYVAEQAELKIHENCDPSGSVGQAMVNIIHNRLKGHVTSEFIKLLEEDFKVQPGFDFDADSSMTRMYIKLFFRSLACFFSYSSPLLQSFRIRRMRNLPIEYRGQDFPETVLWEVLDREEFEDDYTGPSIVNVDEISSLVDDWGGSDCSICLEPPEQCEMRLTPCGHEFCELCLALQLSTEHPNRYKCAYCRASFIDWESTQ